MDLTSALPGKALDPATYSVGACTPRAAVRPESHAELAAALRACADAGLAALPWGGGTALAREAAPARYDVAVDLTAFDHVVEYDPEDMTITAECGVTLDALAGTLAARGQELPVEGADAARATLGGALAANASGPRRLRFGAPRDRILGARFVLGDGTLARTGGRVVKNVTGHAVHRLLCGSRGGLGAIVEASLKLAPAPATRRALAFHVAADAVDDEARWSGLPRLEPAALTLLGARTAAAIAGLDAGPAYTLVAVLEDDAAWVDRQHALLEAALGAPAQRLDGDAVRALARALTDAPERWARRLTFATAWNSPAAIGVRNVGGAASELLFHVPAGRLHLEPVSELPATLVQQLAGRGFVAIDGHGAAWDAPPAESAVATLRRGIRTALDPHGTWANGPVWERGA